jgi:plastocyanin
MKIIESVVEFEHTQCRRSIERLGCRLSRVPFLVSVLMIAAGCSAAAAATPSSAPAASSAPASSPPASSATTPRAQESTISIRDFSFSPVSLTVPVGATVSWNNLDGEPHTVKSIDQSFRSGALDQNDSFSFKFDKPGTYRYVCSIHPQMVGTIVVH